MGGAPAEQEATALRCAALERRLQESDAERARLSAALTAASAHATALTATANVMGEELRRGKLERQLLSSVCATLEAASEDRAARHINAVRHGKQLLAELQETQVALLNAHVSGSSMRMAAAQQQRDTESKLAEAEARVALLEADIGALTCRGSSALPTEGSLIPVDPSEELLRHMRRRNRVGAPLLREQHHGTLIRAPNRAAGIGRERSSPRPLTEAWR